jgi:hypothetical protein
LVGGSEDLLGALFGYRFGIKTVTTAEPVLHITPAILGSLKTQRFATQQRHRFGFYFAEVSRRGLTVSKISFARVQQNVSALVEKSFLRQLRDRVNSELSATGESLHISVCVIERDALNSEF